MKMIFSVINKAGYGVDVVANHPDEALEYALKIGSIRKYENGKVRHVTEFYQESPEGKGLRIPNIIKRGESLEKVLNEDKIGGISLWVERQEYDVTTLEEITERRKRRN